MIIEIIVLTAVAWKIGKIVQEKGRKPFRYQMMAVLISVFGMGVGAITAGLLGFANSAIGLFILMTYGGLAAGVGISFYIVNNLEPTNREIELKSR